MLIPGCTVQAIPAAPGIAIGRIMRISGVPQVSAAPQLIEPEKCAAELERLAGAIERTRKQLHALQQKLREKLNSGEAGIFDAHLLLLDDVTLLGEVRNNISANHYSAEYALRSAEEKFSAVFSAIDDEYLQERAVDLRDIVSRIAANLSEEAETKVDYNEPRILIASTLTPSETASLERDKVLGFAVETGSATSHAAILARSLRLPAVVGVPRQLLDQLTVADKIIIDGFSGKILVNPDGRTEEAYQLKSRQAMEFFSSLAGEKNLPPETTDGFTVQLAANLDAEQDFAPAAEAGAAGVGLFRTEFLFDDPAKQPDEDMQFEVYKKMLIAAGNRPVTIRTIDVGGDKLFSGILRSEEQNPFLGMRGIRLCLRERRDLFDTQLRALLRAGVYGNLRVMLPMISSILEIKETQEIVAKLQKELAAQGIPCVSRLSLGVMIETPVAALIAEKIAPMVDFFSIGTNDLIQYTMAVDRGNARVAHLYRPAHPAILRLIRNTVRAAHANNIFVSVCGQMAEEVMLTPLLVGLEVDELSMPVASIPLQRRTIRKLERFECEELVERALECACAAEVGELAREVMMRRAPEFAVAE